MKAGLLIRQTHHWAADLFVAVIVLHMLRVFFTGAYRKPRELTYWIGLTAPRRDLLEGFLGYSLADDLLSGMGLAIGNAVALSIPFVGANLGALIWDGPFPGGPAFFSRMYIAHVFLLPLVIFALLGAHLTLVALKHHTQFKQGPRQTERKLVGVPLFRADAAIAWALLRHRGDPRTARRARADQPDLALGALPHLPLDERRPAGLVPRLADRGAAPRPGLGLHDRALHRDPEPVLGRGALPRPPCSRSSTCGRCSSGASRATPVTTTCSTGHVTRRSARRSDSPYWRGHF